MNDPFTISRAFVARQTGDKPWRYGVSYVGKPFSPFVAGFISGLATIICITLAVVVGMAVRHG